jgi:beta-catenin-like protein 1
LDVAQSQAQAQTHQALQLNGIKRDHQKSAEELLEEAEAEAALANQQHVGSLDSKSIRKLLTTLERKFNHNVEQRSKYASEPERFLDSELDLDEAVKALMIVATAPELYPLLVDLGAVSTIISLLYHENGDIAADTIELLSELTDADAVENLEEAASTLVDALLKGGLVEAVAHLLQKLNESIAEEAAAVYNLLSIIENVVDIQTETAESIACHPGILDWMLSRIRPRQLTDGNKEYAVEVLGVLLQAGGTRTRLKLVELNGVELLLKALAPYRQRDPGSVEEEEFLENAFVCLCAALMESNAKDAFVEAAGAELMVLMLRGKTVNAKTGALKCLDFATTECPGACDQFIDFGGLGTLFTVFMGKLRTKGRSKGKKKLLEATVIEEEERCISIISNLFRGVNGEERKNRIASKFIEKEFEKADRLMEIYDRYETRVTGAQHQLEARQREFEDDEDDILLERLEAGLYTLQQATLIAAEIWKLGDVQLRKRLLTHLHQRGRTLATLREVLLEYKTTLETSIQKEFGDQEKEKSARGRLDLEHVESLLQGLGYHQLGGDGDGDGGGDEKKLG